MRRGERVLVYGGLVIALAAALGGRLPALPAAAASLPRSASRAEPVEARIATCDVYQIADKLIESDRYQPRLKEEQERLKAQLKPLEDELRQIQERGNAMDPQAEETRALFIEFQRKQQEFQQKVRESEIAYQNFLGSLYVEAYEAAKTAAQNVAEDLGYNYVLASRKTDLKIETTEINQVVQAVLARPVLKAPEGADITEDVIKDLKLE